MGDGINEKLHCRRKYVFQLDWMTGCGSLFVHAKLRGEPFVSAVQTLQVNI